MNCIITTTKDWTTMPRYKNISDDTLVLVTMEPKHETKHVAAKGRAGMFRAFQEWALSNYKDGCYWELEPEHNKKQIAYCEETLREIRETITKQEAMKSTLLSGGYAEDSQEVGDINSHIWDLHRRITRQEERIAKYKNALETWDVIERILNADVAHDDTLPKDFKEGKMKTYGEFLMSFVLGRSDYEYEDIEVNNLTLVTG